MAKKKRHTAAEITAKLAEADTLAVKGRKQSDIAKALGISVMTFHRRRKARSTGSYSKSANVVCLGFAPNHVGNLVDTESKDRIVELELENARLRRLVTDLLQEKMRLEDDQQQFPARAAE
jgi:hypothetical protein